MLNKSSVAMAQILSQTLAGRGVELGPVNNTPVQLLTQLSTQQLELEEGLRLDQGGFERPDLVNTLIEGAEASVDGGNSDHEIELENCAHMLSNVLNATLNLAQNTVTTSIDNVVKVIGETIDEKMSVINTPLQIVQKRMNPIFDSVYLQEAVSRHEGQNIDVTLRSLGLGAVDVTSLLQTGHQGMDAQLGEFLASVGVPFAEQVWSDAFRSSPRSSMDVYGRLQQADAAVLVFFYASKILNDIPEGLNMDLSEWRAYCASLMSSAGAAIMAALAKREITRRVGPLVLSAPFATGEFGPNGAVVVDGEKYIAWLAAGGSPEVIFASVYGNRNFDATYMLENAARLKADWDGHSLLWQNTVSHLRYDAMVEGLRRGVMAEIKSLPEELRVADDSTYVTRLREVLGYTKARDLENLWHLARKAVCRVLYPHTDVEAVLLAIDEQAKYSPNTPVRELALYATIELVARWLGSQLVTREIKS